MDTTVEVNTKYVEALSKPTDCFLCDLDANTYGIEFTAFKIRTLGEETGTSRTLFEIRKDPDDVDAAAPQLSQEEIDAARKIQYQLGSEFLELKNIGTELEFTVGEKEVRDFRLIERHYFRDRIIKSFDFVLPFCMPNSTNTWEIIYTMPELSDQEKQEIIQNPYETRSDSFYFVGEQLIMHNKAEYSYT